MPFKPIIGLLPTPFSLLFGCLAAIRRFLYRTGFLPSEASPVPAIDIGNLAVGGTGKTPHTQYIIRLLKEHFHVAALSRGYGRKSKGYHSILQTDAHERTAEMFGDEPYMTHLRFPDVPIAVDGDRCEGVRNLLGEHPDTEALVLDDAYQHLRFRPSFHILLTEYDRPYRPDMPMPAGKLREFPCAARFADAVIVTKVPDEATVEESTWRDRLRLKPQQHLFFTRFRYEPLMPVTQAAQNRDLATVRDVVLVTGIAHPKPLIQHLGNYHLLQHYAFPDHHTFTENEMQSIYDQHFNNTVNHCVLVTTEKDWMRLQSKHIRNIVSLLPVFVVPVEVEFLTDTQRNTFHQIIMNHVRGKETKNCADG